MFRALKQEHFFGRKMWSYAHAVMWMFYVSARQQISSYMHSFLHSFQDEVEAAKELLTFLSRDSWEVKKTSM